MHLCNPAKKPHIFVFIPSFAAKNMPHSSSNLENLSMWTNNYAYLMIPDKESVLIKQHLMSGQC
jgi:hypothetical protein